MSRAQALPALLLAAAMLPGAAFAQDKAWSPRKGTFREPYRIVKRDGTVINAAGPYKLKEDMALFRILVNGREGPLTSIPAAEIDATATERANGEIALPPSEPAAKPASKAPLYDTRDIATALATDEMMAERERIKRKREEAAAALSTFPTAPPPAAKAPVGEDIDPADAELAQQGKVRRGMRRGGVVMAWGQPDKRESVEREGIAIDEWTYLVQGRAPMLVMLADDRVVQIQQDERLLYTASLKEPPPAPALAPPAPTPPAPAPPTRPPSK